MSRIKFKLVKFDKRLCFEILEQAPLDSGYSLNCTNGLQIISHSPHIDYLKSYKHVYIRTIQRPEDDNRFSVVEFESNEERDTYYNLVMEGFKEFSNR